MFCLYLLLAQSLLGSLQDDILPVGLLLQHFSRNGHLDCGSNPFPFKMNIAIRHPLHDRLSFGP